ncbi:DUF6816 family protein [Rivularia sp. UHCC 0363]|uniref:DUF6816 family protein n=1 Tax=Rivularia sp. UHCC 0363 TaxID=3110244 RepID=UPI002B1F25B2|nr:hypothetical protein [Rivularia sp. UHCC 0363]MEA5592801.1 hypothetical protein [Rivularia sp. UHCC 0363]
MKLVWTFCLIFLLVFCLRDGSAHAGELNRRLNNFPQWEKLTNLQSAVGDLIYPEWIKGEWQVKSTMLDLVAPLAPEIVTPGFESNRQFLAQPVSFQVRFVNQLVNKKTASTLNSDYLLKRTSIAENKSYPVIADRAYNGLNLARAILGDDVVKAVKVDPDSPNRQITFLRGERQLVSIVKSRATESTNGKFIATEVFQQLFKGGSRPYLNSVESTTAYRKLSTTSTSNPTIEANQVTAVYLSSQDPDYFKAANKPVALYRYRLQFFPIASQGNGE